MMVVTILREVEKNELSLNLPQVTSEPVKLIDP